MAVASYKYQTQVLVKDYLLANSSLPFTSILGGIFMCKMAYDFTNLVSSLYFKGYNSLSKIKRIEWSNRGMSCAHAIFITVMSAYFVFLSDLFSDCGRSEPVIFRSSSLSTFSLGVSAGYFLSDLMMILWFYPSLGGMEYVCHHMLSVVSVICAMISSEGQLYTYMVLLSETTTPSINLRWYLDTAGMKRSKAYTVNGISMFFTWLVARIIWFLYFFLHVYRHRSQVRKLHSFNCMLILTVPAVLFALNAVWFSKILRGLRKTLAKRQ